jgi:hypothetical protein
MLDSDALGAQVIPVILCGQNVRAPSVIQSMLFYGDELPVQGTAAAAGALAAAAAAAPPAPRGANIA